MDTRLPLPDRNFSFVALGATVCTAVLALTACELDVTGPPAAEPAHVRSVAEPIAAVPAQAVLLVADRHPARRADLGRITAIETVRTPGKTHGGGALIGGVVGAAVGHEIGDGKALGTGLGAVGGAVLGSEIERRNKSPSTAYRIHVRLDNGSTRTFEAASSAGLHVGDRVRVDGKLLRRA
jgi:outer membrane lipoprotein SlyB